MEVCYTIIIKMQKINCKPQYVDRVVIVYNNNNNIHTCTEGIYPSAGSYLNHDPALRPNEDEERNTESCGCQWCQVMMSLTVRLPQYSGENTDTLLSDLFWTLRRGLNNRAWEVHYTYSSPQPESVAPGGGRSIELPPRQSITTGQ